MLKKEGGFSMFFSEMLKFKRMSPNAYAPVKGSAGAAGLDLFSAYPYMIPPKGKVVIDTDIQVAPPQGYYCRIAPRSGLARDHFLDIGGGIVMCVYHDFFFRSDCSYILGVVDPDYRGNVRVIVFNFSDQAYQVEKGHKVAQLICTPYIMPTLQECDILDDTIRAGQGFGSSGK